MSLFYGTHLFIPDDENTAFQFWQKVSLPSRGKAGERSFTKRYSRILSPFKV